MFKKVTMPMLAVLVTLLGVGALAPAATLAQGNQRARQNDKNLMRNLAIGVGAAAVYEGVKGRTTNALVLGAGAALAGKKYEDARKAQSRDAAPRYDHSRAGDYYNNRRDPRGVTYNAPRDRRDNGKHLGWGKKNKRGNNCDD